MAKLILPKINYHPPRILVQAIYGQHKAIRRGPGLKVEFDLEWAKRIVFKMRGPEVERYFKVMEQAGIIKDTFIIGGRVSFTLIVPDWLREAIKDE